MKKSDLQKATKIFLNEKNNDFKKKYNILSFFNKSKNNIKEEAYCYINSLFSTNGELPSYNGLSTLLEKQFGSKKSKIIVEYINLKYKNSINKKSNLNENKIKKINFNLKNAIEFSFKNNFNILNESDYGGKVFDASLFFNDGSREAQEEKERNARIQYRKIKSNSTLYKITPEGEEEIKDLPADSSTIDVNDGSILMQDANGNFYIASKASKKHPYFNVSDSEKEYYSQVKEYVKGLNSRQKQNRVSGSRPIPDKYDVLGSNARKAFIDAYSNDVEKLKYNLKCFEIATAICVALGVKDPDPSVLLKYGLSVKERDDYEANRRKFNAKDQDAINDFDSAMSTIINKTRFNDEDSILDFLNNNIIKQIKEDEKGRPYFGITLENYKKLYIGLFKNKEDKESAIDVINEIESAYDGLKEKTKTKEEEYEYFDDLINTQIPEDVSIKSIFEKMIELLKDSGVKITKIEDFDEENKTAVIFYEDEGKEFNLEVNLLSYSSFDEILKDFNDLNYGVFRELINKAQDIDLTLDKYELLFDQVEEILNKYKIKISPSDLLELSGHDIYDLIRDFEDEEIVKIVKITDNEDLKLFLNVESIDDLKSLPPELRAYYSYEILKIIDRKGSEKDIGYTISFFDDKKSRSKKGLILKTNANFRKNDLRDYIIDHIKTSDSNSIEDLPEGIKQLKDIYLSEVENPKSLGDIVTNITDFSSVAAVKKEETQAFIKMNLVSRHILSDLYNPQSKSFKQRLSNGEPSFYSKMLEKTFEKYVDFFEKFDLIEKIKEDGELSDNKITQKYIDLIKDIVLSKETSVEVKKYIKDYLIDYIKEYDIVSFARNFTHATEEEINELIEKRINELTGIKEFYESLKDDFIADYIDISIIGDEEDLDGFDIQTLNNIQAMTSDDSLFSLFFRNLFDDFCKQVYNPEKLKVDLYDPIKEKLSDLKIFRGLDKKSSAELEAKILAISSWVIGETGYKFSKTGLPAGQDYNEFSSNWLYNIDGSKTKREFALDILKREKERGSYERKEKISPANEFLLSVISRENKLRQIISKQFSDELNDFALQIAFHDIILNSSYSDLDLGDTFNKHNELFYEVKRLDKPVLDKLVELLKDSGSINEKEIKELKELILGSDDFVLKERKEKFIEYVISKINKIGDKDIDKFTKIIDIDLIDFDDDKFELAKQNFVKIQNKRGDLNSNESNLINKQKEYYESALDQVLFSFLQDLYDPESGIIGGKYEEDISSNAAIIFDLFEDFVNDYEDKKIEKLFARTFARLNLETMKVNNEFVSNKEVRTFGEFIEKSIQNYLKSDKFLAGKGINSIKEKDINAIRDIFNKYGITFDLI